MKNLYFLLLALSFFNVTNAQIVDIPDVNFKAILLATNSTNGIAEHLTGGSMKIDVNNDKQIQVSEALKVGSLNIPDKNITSLVGIQSFSNLQTLNCRFNKLTSLNVTGLTNLRVLYCNTNQLISLTVTGLTKLEYLHCHENQLTSLNVTGLTNLAYLYCENNQLTSLILTGLTNLDIVYCNDNKLTSLNVRGCTKLRLLYCFRNQLTSLNVMDSKNLRTLLSTYNPLETLYVKNGINENSIIFENSAFKYICADEEELELIQKQLNDFGYTNCVVNSYCSFTPGGTFYTLEGNSKIDLDSNGCDSNDKNYSNINFNITDGTNKGNIISDATGNYSIPVGEGTHTITPIIENPNYFMVSPDTISVTFPTQTSPFVQDFCITPKGIYKDLEVTIFPIVAARPGFDATYKIMYKNKGTQTQSGSVVLSFNDAVLDLISANPINTTQLTDKLTWDYTNLKPLESREITVTFNVNSPMETPAVNNGDRLSFNALITPVAGDEKPVDNSMALRQTVVGSYDPNDKTCLEGDIITPDLIGEFVHYLIRFENTGTYPAENVVVKDLIDLTKFDISTLTPTKASHDYVTKISDGNKVEFIFEKINLPFDDANNDGYIAFKIKTLPTLVVNDTFTNEANIYFDYNTI